ncbi:MAG: glycosyltransferase family 39 protein [Candidatus Levyibacteriota bacterium]
MVKASKKFSFIQNIKKHSFLVTFAALFVIFLFLRFYLLLPRANFGWDQVDSAWAANDILVNKHFIINGPVAKGNSGIYMGPLYYFAVMPFYFFTHLNPIASPIFQSLLAIGNFFVLFFITKKIFGKSTALFASFIATFSVTIMNYDRVQSAYYLIVPVSYLIFYALYKVITGEPKYLMLLAIGVGLSFHVDFTSVLYPIFILLALPFFPRTKELVKYILFALPILLIFFLPTILVDIATKHSTSGNINSLLHVYYHGFHVRRFLQIAHDGFISFEQILQFPFLRFSVYLVLPVFMFIYYKINPTKKSWLLFYLMAIWVIVPWVVFSTYSGELTDYYFSFSRDIAIATIAYIAVFLLQQKILLKFIPVFFFLFYAITSMQQFFAMPAGNLLVTEANVRQIIREKGKIPFKDHDASSYMYYAFTK